MLRNDIARMELAGITGQTAAEVDNLVDHLYQEGYRPEPKNMTPNANRNTPEGRQFPNKFTDKVDMDAKPPEKYQRAGEPGRAPSSFGIIPSG